MIAHKNTSRYLPEHTLKAKAIAHAINASFVEQDLVLNSDNIPMVLYDIYLDDITNLAFIFPIRKRKDNRFYVIYFTFDKLKALQV